MKHLSKNDKLFLLDTMVGLSGVRTSDELNKCILSMKDYAPFDHYMLAHSETEKSEDYTVAGRRHYWITDYSEDWLVEFEKNNYILKDPVLLELFSSLDFANIQRWSKNFIDAIAGKYKNITEVDDSIKFIKAAGNYGMRDGICLSAGNPFEVSAISFASTDPDFFKNRVYQFFNILRDPLHDAIKRLSNHESLSALTRQEIGIFQLYAEGESLDIIAEKLSICRTTVKTRLESGRFKMNAATNTNAMAKIAVAGGLRTNSFTHVPTEYSCRLI